MQTGDKNEDGVLIASYRNGDIEALSGIIDKYRYKIFTSIVILVKDQHLAEDIFQETFVKIIDKINAGSYVEQGKFLPWAIRIAHNLCIDYFRRKKKNKIIRNNEENDVFNFIPFDDPDPEESIIFRQSQRQIRALLEHLSPEQREVIVLRHYGGLSFKEISQRTNVSINTALGRMRYGLINLRKIVKQNKISL